MIVMLGGPTMNLLIYLVLTVDPAARTLGTAHDDPTTTVGSVSKCVVPANAPAAQQNLPGQGSPNSPARRSAGCSPATRSSPINGTPITQLGRRGRRVIEAVGRTSRSP